MSDLNHNQLNQLIALTDILIRRYIRANRLFSSSMIELDDFASIVRLTVYKHRNKINLDYPHNYIKTIISSRFRNYLRDQRTRMRREAEILQNSCWPWQNPTNYLGEFEEFLKKKLTSEEYDATLLLCPKKYMKTTGLHWRKIKKLRKKVEQLEKAFWGDRVKTEYLRQL